MGRIAQSFGFKYGDRGLWYEHYYKGINLGKIILSKNQREIYTFLDLSYDRFEEGFNDLEDIFKFISTSKCFNYEKFYLSSLSKINRERNKKRKSYMSFLDWIENNVNETTSKPLVEKLSINEINELFPSVNLLEQIKVLEEDYDRKLLIKSKFNGSLVIEKYGFKEKELSLKLNNFKEYINTNFNVGYDNFILNNDIENICLEFENSYL